MAGASEVIACQRQLASLLGRMIVLARDGQFRQLPGLDAQCAAVASSLNELDVPALSGSERASIADLLERIGADQAELNALVRPQFLALMERIGEQRWPHARMRGRKQPTHDPEKCPPGGARSSARHHPD